MSNTNTSPAMEDEYQGLNEVLYRYLTGERMVDDVLADPYCQREIQKTCRCITRDADEGRELAQSLYEHILRRDREGPEIRTRRRARSLRTADIHTLDEFLAYLYVSALNLARSGWRKRGRRNKLREVVPDPVDNFRSVKSNCADPEAKCLHNERLEQIGDLSALQRLALMYWAMDYTARDIAGILSRTGDPCSHVTVQTWIKDALTKLRGESVISIRKAS